MATIRHMAHHGWRAGLLALAVMTAVGFGKCEHRAGKFKHSAHLEMTEECDACHDAGEEGKLPTATHEQCLMCHDFDITSPDEECLICHTLPEKESVNKPGSLSASQWQTVIAAMRKNRNDQLAEKKDKRGDIKFEHVNHDALDCSDCHGDAAKDELKSALNMDLCMACHMEIGADSCETCHKILREDAPPESHKGKWDQAHGLEAHLNEKTCGYCHDDGQAFCDECHQMEKPESHTAFFRKRGHGFFAENDRRNCTVCHQTDFCDACHFEEEPKSHTSRFKRSGHCQSCHFPMREGTKCQVCHREGRHPRAGAFEHPVQSRLSCAPCHHGRVVPHSTLTVRSNQCGVCHAQGAPTAGAYPHPIQGLNSCLPCHTSGFQGHPTAGISERDCAICHVAGGTGDLIGLEHPLSSVSCTICHSANIVPHPVAGLSDNDCRICHIEGSRIPFTGGSLPHPVAGLPPSSCVDCHVFSKRQLNEALLHR